jgi:heparinase II/III-like protein
MNWGEASTRVSQEVSRRLDLALYRSGLGSRAPRLKLYLASRPKFFFGTDDDNNGPASRAALLRLHLPGEAEAIIQEGDEICRHQFRLLGYDKLDYGPNIDWHSAQGKSSNPSDPWFIINFLDFHKVGDHKVVWELNRHQHLVTLAKAWTLTGNRIYTTELVNQWYSWQRANPYPLGINWASALEVAFRSLSWLWVRYLLAGCADLSPTFQTDLLLALQLQGRHIERYLSTYFSPNTHLLGEAFALFFIGTLCPEISAAQRWRDRGWKIILEESVLQVRPDGIYFEQALHYQVYALDFFLHARILASENGITIPKSFDNVAKKMLDVLRALSEVGPPEGFGDDDGGRLFNPRRNQVECMTDPLALGAILYGSDKYANAGLTEEAIWLFGGNAIHVFAKPHPGRPAASRAFAAGGIYLINDQNPYPEQLMIDAGPQGTGQSGHGHADALSIRFSLDGRRFLIDPGTYCYVSDGKERDWYRGTGAHNTLRVDSLDQAVPQGPFAWSSIPHVKAKTWVNGESFDLFAGSHDGYCRLPEPVLHRRTVFHVKGGIWFIRDAAEGEGNHLLESFWHFAPELKVTQEHGIFFAESISDPTTNSAGLALLIDCNSPWTSEITEGFVSRAYGSKQIAPVVRVSANVKLPADCAVLLLPSTPASDIGTFSAIGDSSVDGVRGYRYQTSRSAEFLFFFEGSGPWICGDWTSDASLLYCKLEQRKCAQVIMVYGSFAKWRGKPFVSRSSSVEKFEWRRHSGLREASSSQEKPAEDLAIVDFEFLDSET